jgi:DNA-binding Lrp family transcriptional regulator
MEKETFKEVMQYLLYLFSEQPIIVNTSLTKKLSEKFNLSRYQVYRLVKRLEKEGVIETYRVSRKLYSITLTNPSKVVDLIKCEPARNPETSNTEREGEPNTKELLRHARELLKPRWRRQNSNHKEATDKYMLKTTLTEEEREEVASLFELWLMDVQDKVLWFRKPDGTDEFLPYVTRFTDKSKALEILRKAENCFQNALSMHNLGIFLTITLPPIFPQRLALWILTFLTHRIKAKILRAYKESKPHIRVNEPQASWNPHTHIIIFGIDFLMNKNELTQYLEKHLNNFLNNLGRHYKKTINKKATDYDIMALNLLGSIYAKKYAKYKKQHKKYVGPINWITRIQMKDGILVFENPPPDRGNEHGAVKTMKDGGDQSVFDYLKYYMVSAVMEAKEIQENGVSKVKNMSLPWYWFNRMPFFYASKILRSSQKKRIPAGWEFIGAFRLKESNWLAELMERSSIEVIFQKAVI